MNRKNDTIRLIDNIPCYISDIATSDSRYIINLNSGKSKFIKEKLINNFNLEKENINRKQINKPIK